jgi:hypothetical protein
VTGETVGVSGTRREPTTDELVAEGMAAFRSIVGRSSAGLCTVRIARDRYCPRPTITERGLYCQDHRRRAEEDDRRIEALMVEDWNDDQI